MKHHPILKKNLIEGRNLVFVEIVKNDSIVNQFYENQRYNLFKKYNFNQSPESLITAISYPQFVAYWIWKQRQNEAPKIKSKNPIVSHYIPNETEFLKIQQGKTIYHPKEVYQLPSPVFRYVIEFYKN